MATNKKSTIASTSKQLSSTRSHESRYARMGQNFHAVCLYESMNEANNDDCCNAIIELRQFVNTVDTFTDVDKCINYMNDSGEEKIFMIISGALSKTIVRTVHDMPQVDCIYIYCKNKEQYKECTEEWYKVKGVFTDITEVCERVRQTTLDCEDQSVSISFITTEETVNPNLDTLDQSFMYSQILKEILLTIDFGQEYINKLLKFCRKQFSRDSGKLSTIEKLCKEYHNYEPIWWYTGGGTLYSMLNEALRRMEVELIIKLGFYVRDLHNNITELHSQQYGAHQDSHSFKVYRGQGLSLNDFEKLKKTKGGLISFNNFLSTSHDQEVARLFAESNGSTGNQIGVLFAIDINPSISSSLFADIQSVSHFQGEKEILFSMHSVFRIGEVKQIDNDDRLWQVDLTLTCDNDPQLHALTKRLREETASDYSGWHRLGLLMIKLGQFEKAKKLYKTLLKQSTDPSEVGHLYYQLGSITIHQGEYKEAITFYEDALEIYQKLLPSHYDELAGSYNSIGLAYDNMGECTKALSYYEKAHEIARKTLPANDPRWYSFDNNIGAIYSKMGEYSKALSYYKKAHETLEKTLPPNHPNFATSYNNTAWVNDKMGEYPKALSNYKKALAILEKTLPENHPQFVISYNNIGMIYDTMGKYSESLTYLEKALEILKETLPQNHPLLATNYNNLGATYENMGKQTKALENLEKALKIRQATLPENHPDLASSYHNIGVMYNSTTKQSESLAYLEKALKIRQAILPANHPSLASSYNGIGNTYYNMNEYSKALSCFERALDINQHSLPPNHPAIEKLKGSIEVVKRKL